jgi:ssDNA-binding Zn-finger/Zn-ribbon topoisomerase 1
MASGISVQEIRETSKVHCPVCSGTQIYRLQRKGFLENAIYPLFGYYPWECPACRELHYLKQRSKRRHKRPAESL